ncbi:hypothetical protein GLYMA_06G237300v4 [Glycine max]|uniref:Photosynthesis system II assembly factor Ycf48/Hcf136-like domain-containing protein n=2 Tax=Glycine subgen. Soja TaxID=1462606 RepID=A0A0R0JUX1_SOYBN|nr:hypothetical protein JHK87_016203 [Glycine soja]KAH1127340.1 hypothetical protein GYH30_016069 [Glycine max]KRH55204.1 hypothetical protein GLYMA_06G237300v4 [Glycine max]RZB42904.1 Photosystem II stability/assembly factor HCF136, chloroplastic [Glycine soja]RZC08910.1 Photosystem II stability/assembly factor HCF136, chloroplastic [Glycine soja]
MRREGYQTKVCIKVIGEKSAKMVTDEGAIYVIANRGYNWRAIVQETVSATLNSMKVLPGKVGKDPVYGILSLINTQYEGAAREGGKGPSI